MDVRGTTTLGRDPLPTPETSLAEDEADDTSSPRGSRTNKTFK